MVSTRRGGRGRGRGEGEASKAEEEEGGGKRGEYEESRANRIKENMERMKSLGIADLSKQLKRQPASSSSLRKTKPPPASSNDPPRRSSRLKEVPRVSYSEKKSPKKDSSSSSMEVEIHIPEGENPEVYTDEHEKMLGNSTAAWTLYVDGFDEDGQRMYDPILGKSCHQCRQKTLGLHTSCSKCSLVAGQFCGDCLYMRYGENVTEVNLKEDWVCPVCRGICNCSRCRREKGWHPTGAIYKKVAKLGFKSVAHYLIHTRGEGAILEAAESPSAEKEGSFDAVPQSGAKEHVIAEDAMKLDDDDEYEGDDLEEQRRSL